MKYLNISASAAALLLAAIIPATSFADVPPVDPAGRSARILCGNTAGGQQVFAAHADKIIFTLSGALVAQQQADQAALNAVPRDTELDIKVLDDPRTIAPEGQGAELHPRGRHRGGARGSQDHRR